MGSITDKIKGWFSSKKPVSGIKTSFQTYLDRAYASSQRLSDRQVEHGDDPWFNTKLTDSGPPLKRGRIPIAIWLEGTASQHHQFAHKFGEREHYSGSLVKVAAMYSAFRLRAQALALADELKNQTPKPTVDQFFSKLWEKSKWGDVVGILRNDAHIVQPRNTPGNQVPRFREILSVTNSPTLGFDVKFDPGFLGHMEKMIIASDNCSAAECIQRLGYHYINLSLMEKTQLPHGLDRFFDPSIMKGIWLAGDYWDARDHCPGHPGFVVTIPTENDCDLVAHDCNSKQNTTATEMASLFFKILTKDLFYPKIVGIDLEGEMERLLERSQDNHPPAGQPTGLPSFLTRSSATKRFKVTAGKIGVGELKKNNGRGETEIDSEGILITWQNVDVTHPETSPEDDPNIKKQLDEALQWRHLTGRAAICYQNLNATVPVDGIIRIINFSINNFIRQK